MELNPEVLKELPDGRSAIAFEYPTTFARSQIKEALKHIRLSKARQLPQLYHQAEKPGKCIIVGAAPSARNYVDEIRAYASDPANAVFAVNETHDWLIQEHGIIPHGAVVFEVSKELIHLFRKPHPDVTYYISSMCHPSQFRALLGNKMVLWHPYSDVEEHVKAMLGTGAAYMVGGGSTTFLRTIPLAQIIGYRDFEIYGTDCSYEDESHLKGSSEDNGPPLSCIVDLNDKLTEFKSYAYLIRQCDEFKNYCENNHHKFRMRVHGDGLMPFVHRSLYPSMYQEIS